MVYHTSNKVRIVRIVLPPVLTVVLFCAAIFVLFLPALETSIMAQKREMIRELTHTAWNTLEMFHRREHSGELTREQAQVSAVRHLRSQRYGPEKKDYFWIMNMQPRMIMHPDLTRFEGLSVSTDNNLVAKRILDEVMAIARSKGAGYVDYDLLWEDGHDPIGKKLTYVQAFEPWQWVVGTGVARGDAEIQLSTQRWKLVKICLMIFGAIGVLLVYAVQRELTGAGEQQLATKKIQTSEENLRSILMALPDPVIVYDVDGRVTYLNKAFTRVFGWELSELKGRRIDFIPDACKPDADAMMQETTTFGYCVNFETQRYKKAGDIIDVSISSAHYRDAAGKSLGIIFSLHNTSELNT